ncbi:hypothetical protein GH714_029592 [Hevea brasiliensis]|uniref:CCHC-type domain-containing protein n=1 Tax=Hevea brasiliensis TaxID=3981 RepID=A0A6A6K8L7_HEVBR|nr:hypothetical protein GH714_029592 [Hevea brasiliensis]
MSHIELERAKRERELKEKEEASKIESSITAAGTLFPEKESSVSLKYPMLTKSNYAAWAIKMEVFMMAQGVWDAIESPDPIDSRRDKMALAAIYQGIGEDTLLQLGAKKTAKEAWNMLKMMNQGADKVKEVRSQTLWREFEALRMGDSENVDDFSGKLTIIVNKLRNLGNTVEEERVVKKLLRSVSSKFLQIVSAIEEFSDLTTKSFLFDSRGGDDESKPQKKKFDKSKIKCYGCGKMGHFASECLSKEKDEQANLTETEEVEPALLLIENCELNVSKEEIYIEEPSLLMIETCEVTEGEVYVAATGGSLMKEAGWYLDTGASNHMAGDINYFSEIDQSIFGKVKFGDESVIIIHGLGSVLFQCKNGEHLTLTNVYYIPKLKSNIISLGQIDENGGRVIIEGGILRVYDDLNRLTIKVKRQPNRLFVAKLQVAEKVSDKKCRGDDTISSLVSVKGVMIGYEEGSKAYRLYDPVKKKLIISRDVIFEEEKSWPWQSEKKEEELENVDIFTVKLRDAGGATTVSEGGSVT